MTLNPILPAWKGTVRAKCEPSPFCPKAVRRFPASSHTERKVLPPLGSASAEYFQRVFLVCLDLSVECVMELRSRFPP